MRSFGGCWLLGGWFLVIDSIDLGLGGLLIKFPRSEGDDV